MNDSRLADGTNSNHFGSSCLDPSWIRDSSLRRTVTTDLGYIPSFVLPIGFLGHQHSTNVLVLEMNFDLINELNNMPINRENIITKLKKTK